MDYDSDSYEWGKRLKEAGYPQDKSKGYITNGKATMAGFNNNYEEVCIPHYEQLLEEYIKLKQNENEKKEKCCR